MRSFSDPSGATWDVLIGRESWGTHVLLFSRRDGTSTRQLLLAAETSTAAEQELDALSDDELRARLAQSTPWGV